MENGTGSNIQIFQLAKSLTSTMDLKIDLFFSQFLFEFFCGKIN